MTKLTSIVHIGKGIVLSKTAKDTYLIFSSNIASAFFSFIFTLILIRNLTVADFGYFSALLSFLLLVADLLDLGIGSSLSSFLPSLIKNKIRLHSFLKTAFITHFIIATFLCTVIFFLSNQFSLILFHDEKFGFLVKITSFGIYASIVGSFFQYALLALQKFISVSIISILNGFSRLALIVIVLIVSTINLDNSVWVQSISLLITLLVAAILLRIDFIKAPYTGGDFKKLISFSYLLATSRGVSAVVGKLDVLMIVSLIGAYEVGVYSTAARLISIFTLLSASFSTVIAPKLAAITDQKKLKQFIAKVIFVSIGLILIVLLFIFIADPIMTILFSEKGKIAVSVFQLLLISMIFFIASIPAVSLAVYYLKKPEIVTINNIIQLIIVFFINWYLIPKVGRHAAATSLIIAYALTFITTSLMSYYYLKKKFELL